LNKYYLLLFLIIAIIVVAVFSTNLIPQTITGTIDSDMLLKSGSPTYMEGQNQLLTGNVVLMNFQVGASNDVAAIGTYDDESTTISALGDTATYHVRAKKVKSNTIIQLPAADNRILRNISTGTYSNHMPGPWIGLIWDKGQEERSLLSAVQSAYNDCRTMLGSNLASFAWRPATANDLDNINRQGGSAYSYTSSSFCINGVNTFGSCLPAGYWLPEIYYTCHYFSSGNISYQSGSASTWGVKTVDVEVDVEVVNNQNETSSLLKLASGNCGTNCRTSGYFIEDDETIGYAKITGWEPTNELDVDIDDEAPAVYNYARVLVSKNAADSAWQTLRTLQTVPTFTNPVGNYAAIEQDVTSYTTSYTLTVESISTKFDNAFSFTYNSGLNAYILNNSYVRDIDLQVIVKGEWIGLIRDVADFEIICPTNTISAAINTPNIEALIKVKNISSVNSSGSLLWSCPTGNGSRSLTISAGSTYPVEVAFNASSAAVGDCTFVFDFGTDTRECDVAYNFYDRPEDCGNGVFDDGETCANCPSDVFCGLNQYCEKETGVCKGLDECGNGLIETGENCFNCPRDIFCGNGMACILVEGEGVCQDNTLNTLFWILVVILVVFVTIAITYFMMRKKQNKKGVKKK